jgi:hypothetical protein
MMRFEQGTRWYGGDNQDALSTTQSVAKRHTNTYYSIEPKVDMRKMRCTRLLLSSFTALARLRCPLPLFYSESD